MINYDDDYYEDYFMVVNSMGNRLLAIVKGKDKDEVYRKIFIRYSIVPNGLLVYKLSEFEEWKETYF